MIKHVWIIPLLPLVAAAVIGWWGDRGKKWAGLLASSTIFFSLMLSCKLLFTLWQHPGVKQLQMLWMSVPDLLPINIGMLVDPLSALMLVIVTFISLVVQIYSLGYMAEDEGQARYFAYMAFFTFSMLGLVLAHNLLILYMFWELVGLSSYLLIGFWYHKPEAANAAKKAFIVTRFGDLGFLISILLLAYLLNTLDIIAIGQAVAAGRLNAGWLTLIALLIFAGAMGKSGQFPLHVWLPDAMEGPTPVSALIHAATMVAAGVFLVARLFPLFAASETALGVIAYVGGFTALFSATIACVQDDIKRILAYSTLSQLGYMMMALGCGGYVAGVFHLTTHAVFKALLFLAAGAIIHALHTNSIWKMGGLLRPMKVTAMTMLAAALALAGVFPFAGFFSKDLILLTTLNTGHLDLFWAGILTAGVTSFYIFRMFFIVFTGSATTENKAQEAPWVMALPLVLLAGLSLGLGFLGTQLKPFLHSAWGALAITGYPHNRWVTMAAFLAAVFGFSWAYLVYYQKAISNNLLVRRFAFIYRIVSHKYYIDEIYQFLVQKILFLISAAMAWFDRHIVDGAVNGVGWLCRLTGQGLRQLQAGRLQAYLIAFVVGVVVVIVSVLATHPIILAFIR